MFGRIRSASMSDPSHGILGNDGVIASRDLRPPREKKVDWNMMTIACPNCGRRDKQVKAGVAGDAQRYKCVSCGRRYALNVRPRKYPKAIQDRALELHVSGKSNRQIALELSVSAQTVGNWILNAPPTNTATPAPPPIEPVVKSRVTIADVARHAGVSTSTISNYLNDKGRMSQKTRLRIEDAMKGLYFTPNALVRAIRDRRTHTLGLVTYGIYDLEHNVERSIIAPILGAINRAADNAEYDVLLYTGWPHRSRSHTGSDFLNGQIDGLLWMSPQPYHPQIRFAAAAGLPVIAIMSKRVPNGVGYVVADNAGGIHKTINYLVGRGHTRIAYMGAKGSSDFIDRASGYREGLAAAGVAYDPELEVGELKWEQWSMEGVALVIQRWLRMKERPTAIVTVDDLLAEYAINWIRGHGLRVPEDVAVTGFNGLPNTETLCGGITTLQQPFGEIGKIAVERLNAMISGAPVSECRITVPVSLMIRSSTERQTEHP
jgi:DNA-binding LacI/PurR family transcriptional regulator/transposase-like protein